MELLPIIEQDHYALKNFEEVKAYVVKLIAECNTTLVIQDDDTKHIQNQSKKELKAILGKVENARKKVSEIITNQYKDIEKILKDGVSNIDTELDRYKYEVLKEERTPKLVTLEIKSKDENFLRVLKEEIEQKNYNCIKSIAIKQDRKDITWHTKI